METDRIIPFQPEGQVREQRNKLRQYILNIKPFDEPNTLYASFRGKKLPNQDLENILFYNIDSTLNTFSELDQYRILFEYSETTSNTQTYYYEIASSDKAPQYCRKGNSLITWSNITYPGLNLEAVNTGIL